MNYRGDLKKGQTLFFDWNSAGADGASITLATNGTISVYKDDNLVETTVGVTLIEDVDGRTGVHNVEILTADSFYEIGKDYHVVSHGMTIDGVTVNAVIASFSIENRAPLNLTKRFTIQTGTTGTVLETDLTETITDFWVPRVVQFEDGALAGMMTKITGYNATTKALTVDDTTTAASNGDIARII